MLIGSCAPIVTIAPEDPGFPAMNREQVQAMRSCVVEHPPLAEWAPRYAKAWCKAKGLSAEDCHG